MLLGVLASPPHTHTLLFLVSLSPVCLFPGWAGLFPSSLPSYDLHTCYSSPDNHLHLPPVLKAGSKRLPSPVCVSSLSGNSFAQKLFETCVFVYSCSRALCSRYLFLVCPSPALLPDPARLAQPGSTLLWTSSNLWIAVFLLPSFSKEATTD